jgi:hypothetical protein
MKRWQKIFLGLALILVTWLWSFNQLDLCSWLAIPICMAAIVALYAAYDILGSIVTIKSYPEERTSLDEEIRKAK